LTRRILAIDTATDALSVAVGVDGELRFSAFQRRRRGHAEVLIPLVQHALSASGIGADEISEIGVTLGPGTFTGVRIGLAAARGFRVATGVPVTGVGTLELLAFRAGRRWPDRPVMAALDARRNQVYAQYFRRGGGAWPEAWSFPAAMPAAEAASQLVPGTVLTGSGAPLIATAEAPEVSICDGEARPDATDLIALLSARPQPTRNAPAPNPIYLRAPDATPARPLLDL